MASRFTNIRFMKAEKSDEEMDSLTRTEAPAVRGAFSLEAEPFASDEEAARFYLDRVLQRDERPAVRGLAAEPSASPAEGMRFEGSESSELTGTSLVRFQQTCEEIPIFGSHTVVELDQQRNLLGIDADIATELEGVAFSPTLSEEQALESIARFVEIKREALRADESPELVLYHDDESETWHLAWHCKGIHAAPAAFFQGGEGKKSHRGRHGLASSPRERRPVLDYLVDAHDGAILLYYSATPMIGTPVQCWGIDELGARCDFFGSQVGHGFALVDPLGAVETYDMNFGDVNEDHPRVPKKAISNTLADFGDEHRAAVSAHVNAARVQDFYREVLKRSGVDGKGMTLVSIINCIDTSEGDGPEWCNAIWWQKRMWYGQIRDAEGKLRSLSSHLDIIAHELTHGVTEHTAKLIYYKQSGALNESFSDIFGVIIANHYNAGPKADISAWRFEIGKGLGEDKKPLRDFSNPRLTDDPDHMDDYLNTTWDSGGVHTNSNIHNKAAYNVLSAKTKDGARMFTPREVAILYYLTLLRLPASATFQKTLRALLDAATVFFAGDEAARKDKLEAITEAYGKVGIVLPDA